MPRPDLASVDAIAYLDTAGDSQTLDFATVCDVTAGQLSLIYLKVGQTWPSTLCRDTAVTITYTGGSSSPPEQALQAVILLASHWYLNREATAEKAPVEVPYATENLIYHLQPGDDFRTTLGPK